MIDEQPTELEMKLLILLLLHGGQMEAKEWWPLRREIDPVDTRTHLKDKGLTEVATKGFRISAKGRKAVEEASYGDSQ